MKKYQVEYYKKVWLMGNQLAKEGDITVTAGSREEAIEKISSSLDSTVFFIPDEVVVIEKIGGR